MAPPTVSQSSYPLAQLQQARLDFRSRWNHAAQRDPTVRNISEWHRQFPPLIKVINCAEYPFAEDTAVYQTPQPINNPTIRPSDRKRPYPNELDTLTQCAKLSETVCANQLGTAAHDISNQCYSFSCDNCSFSCLKQSDALAHLETEQHTSCSGYGLRDSQENQTLVLCEPRTLYNSRACALAWLSDKTAIVCPTCLLIFPDKLMCAYHHQSQHNQLSPEYAIGTVLAVRELIISDTLRCNQCRRTFLRSSEYADHWATPYSPGCHSPFAPVPEDPGQLPANLIVQAHCHWCRARFERSWEPKSNDSSAPKSKRSRPIRACTVTSEDSQPYFFFSGFARFCLNHLYLHLGKVPGSARMHIRFIRLPRASACLLPPYQKTSDSDLLLMSIHECKRLVTYLERLKGLRKKRYKQTKQRLAELLQEARQMESS